MTAVEDSAIGAGPIALVILLLLLIATFLLIRNMNARIRRLPPEFPEQQFPEQPNEDEPTPKG